jgi:hypothetical protein
VDGGGAAPDTAPDAPADTGESDAAPDTPSAQDVTADATAAYASDAGYRSTFVSSVPGAAAAPGARAAGPRPAPSDVAAAQRTGGSGDPWSATPAAESRWAGWSRRRVIPRRAVGVVVAAVIVSVVWAVPALRQVSSINSSGGSSTMSGSYEQSGSYDPTRLRMMLDQAMAINRGLPSRVSAPRPRDAARATALYHRITDWHAAHPRIAPSDERLARTGAVFARALGVWLLHPTADAAYQAYLEAWRRWDAADPTWQSK